ncbi:MAG: pyridoxal phosphate-dependent aminotransferase [Ignavibacteriae bacterium]|nr:pyridoxal phosphate-dependent aminotransferase [Ignavibacteriota bacterium]
MLKLSKKAAGLEASQTLALFARAKKMKAEGLDVVSLTAGEPDFPTPQPVKDAGIKAINDNFTKYTANPGIPELLKAISEKLSRENNVNFPPSQILVSNGAKHSVYNALQAICNKGDEVLIPAPYWVSYPEMAKLADATPVVINSSIKNDFKITPAQLKKAITKKTKVLILNSPSNPTGSVYSRAELEALGEVVRKTGIYVISDEIYEKVMFDGETHFSIGSIDAIRDQVITINGVSKAYSMTGWRIGYMAAHKDIYAAAEKLQSQMTSNASSISQRAAHAALTVNFNKEIAYMVSEFDKRRRYLMEQFKSMNVEFNYPKGAFYLFVNMKPFFNTSADGVKIKTADDLSEYFLMKHHLAMVPGGGFGAKDFVRISYACSMAELEKAVERLRKGFGLLRD